VRTDQLQATAPLRQAEVRVLRAEDVIAANGRHIASPSVEETSMRINQFQVSAPLRQAAERVLREEEEVIGAESDDMKPHNAMIAHSESPTEEAETTFDTLSVEEDPIIQAQADVETATLEEQHPQPTNVVADSLSVRAAPEPQFSDVIPVDGKSISQVKQVAAVSCFDCSSGALRSLVNKAFCRSVPAQYEHSTDQ